jgi:hypothetical protein
MHFGRMVTDASLTTGEIEMTPSQWLKSSLKDNAGLEVAVLSASWLTSRASLDQSGKRVHTVLCMPVLISACGTNAT